MDTNRAFKIFLLALATIALTVLIACIFLRVSYRMPYIQSNVSEIRISMKYCSDEVATAHDDIDRLFGYPEYKLTIVDKLSNGSIAQIHIISGEIWIIDNPDLFAFNLAHELTHLTKFTYSERYCNYNAFNLLYYSGNNYLKYCALMWACYDYLGFLSEEYSFIGNLDNIDEFIYNV